MDIDHPNTVHTLEAAMMAVPSRLGLASRKAGSDRAALKRKELMKWLQWEANLRKKLTYSAR